MSEPSLRTLSADEAHEILTQYAATNLGAAARVALPNFRDDFNVWESWVSGVDGYVKAYIVRLGPTNGQWVCRHITVMDAAPGPRKD